MSDSGSAEQDLAREREARDAYFSEVWVDHDYVPMPRVYEKCSKCDNDLMLRHYCTAPLDDLRAIVSRGIESGNRSGGYYHALRDALNFIDAPPVVEENSQP